jgi:hypothetical protein
MHDELSVPTTFTGSCRLYLYRVEIQPLGMSGE